MTARDTLSVQVICMVSFRKTELPLTIIFSIKPILFYFVNKPLSLETGALDLFPLLRTCLDMNVKSDLPSGGHRCCVPGDRLPDYLHLPLYLGHLRGLLQSLHRSLRPCRWWWQDHIWRFPRGLLLAQTQHSRGINRKWQIACVPVNKEIWFHLLGYCILHFLKSGVQVSFLIHISLLLYTTHLATSIVYYHFFFDQDSKVMSWWDYGYQITAMANRTILVDNNTWNNTHISRVGQVEAARQSFYLHLYMKSIVQLCKTAVKWLKYCRYGANPYLINHLWSMTWKLSPSVAGYGINRRQSLWNNERIRCQLCISYIWRSNRILFWR